MPPLPSDLRRVLENAVIAAREEATTAAGAALKRLAVEAKDFPPYLTPEERSLRLKLRAAARQLGDPWNADKQAFTSLNKLTHEVAYEHWHRMLFARFLAENNLLIHPEHNVPVDLATVAELAQEDAAKSGSKADTWATAGCYAAAMLPQIFRPDDPALAVQLAPEHQQALEKVLESLPPQVFTADDSLGWVYQFWQSAEKERVNAGVKGGDKITGETLPAVTQLFTEHYMVLFLLHNTVGAWWAGKEISKSAKQQSSKWENEADVRAAVALPGYSFDYLRFVKDEATGVADASASHSATLPLCHFATSPSWRPAAGVFSGWPGAARELKVLDPCCGSGHFLVAVFELLTRLRMAEEGLDAKAAALAVIADNLFGLELDARCTQIAAFNVAQAAWRLAGEHFPIPELHVACAGLAPNCTQEQWLKLADTRMGMGRRSASPTHPLLPTHGREAIKNALRDMHELFTKAPELGSLIDPTATAGTLGAADWETVKPFLTDVLAEESKGGDADALERAVAAQGMAKAAEILSGDYTLVITNVPYLGRGGQGDLLKAFAEKEYPEAKADLATVFVQRMLKWLASSTSPVGHSAPSPLSPSAGTIAAVTPQNWLFLTSYKKLRERLLKERTWNMVARLGPGAFETIGGHVVNVALITLSGGKPAKEPPHGPHVMAGVDASGARSPAEKAALLRGDAAQPPQTGDSAPHDLKSDPHETADIGEDSADPAAAAEGASPADGSIKLVPQVEQLKNPEARILTRIASRMSTLQDLVHVVEGSGRGDTEQYDRVFWELGVIDADIWSPFVNSPAETMPYAGRESVFRWEKGKGSLADSSSLRIRGGSAWGKDTVFVARATVIKATICTGEVHAQNGVAVIPNARVDLVTLWAFCTSDTYRREVQKLSNKILMPSSALWGVPFDLAHWQKVAAEKYPGGLPEPQSDDPTQWLFHGHPAGRVPLTPDPNPHLATVLQLAVARLVGYKWPAELDPKMRLAPEARAWVEKCKDLESHADDDGVVPLVNINKERPGHERLRALLEAAFGDRWAPGLLNDLLAAAGAPGKGLDDWLKHDFWAQHCAVFHHRPFVWQIWDGKKDGFNILVHYHRLAEDNGKGEKLLQKITYTYLGDWIAQQQSAAKRGEAGADTRLKAAQDLQKKLETILAGEPPYDIFVRWKPLHEQPIGWNPDINDGVRVNIRPFVTAGVLRGKVNVKWTKDRGKEPESIRPKAKFPWFWSCPEDEPPVNFAGGAKFTGERLNDLHYTRGAKDAARTVTEQITRREA